jgi:hypothetical protein
MLPSDVRQRNQNAIDKVPSILYLRGMNVFYDAAP